MKTVAVVEGWAGGPKLTRRFRQELERAGFQITSNLKRADVIFAHSTGCYLLPKDIKAELIVAVDPPYWPGRSIAGSWIDLIKTDLSLLRSGSGAGGFISKKFWEIYYIFAKPSFSWSVLRNQSDLSFLKKHKNTTIVVVRNKDDEFCSAAIAGRLNEHTQVKYIELPGNHEDYYVNPQPYIDLLHKAI